MSKDPETAAMNFLKALEKLPGYIEQEEKKIAELRKDVPILQEVVSGTWKKESRLSDLKTEVAANRSCGDRSRVLSTKMNKIMKKYCYFTLKTIGLY